MCIYIYMYLYVCVYVLIFVLYGVRVLHSPLGPS